MNLFRSFMDHVFASFSYIRHQITKIFGLHNQGVVPFQWTPSWKMVTCPFIYAQSVDINDFIYINKVLCTIMHDLKYISLCFPPIHTYKSCFMYLSTKILSHFFFACILGNNFSAKLFMHWNSRSVKERYEQLPVLPVVLVTGSVIIRIPSSTSLFWSLAVVKQTRSKIFSV